MLVKALLLFVLGLSAIGLGTPLLRVLAPTAFADASWPMGLAGLIGLFMAASTATVVNFFAPVSPAVSFSILAFGLVVFVLIAKRPDWLSWAAFGALVVAVTPITLSQSVGYDGGLYHLPVQLWMVSEKVVFGLANLHGRFGFNSLVEALLALGWVNNDDLAIAQLVSGLFTLFFLLAVVEFLRDSADNAVLRYISLMAGVGFLWMHRHSVGMGWSSTDLPTALAVVICLACGLNAALRDDRDYLVLSFIFAALAISLKVSSAIVVVFPLGVAAIHASRHGWRCLPFARLVVVTVAFLPWAMRGFVLSGCLAYPLWHTCLPVSWEASREALHDSMWVTAWARAPRTGLQHLVGWDWLALWFPTVRGFLASLVLLTIAGMAIAWRLKLYSRGEERAQTAVGVLFTGYAVVACAFWFLAAPAPRFGLAALLALAAVPGLWLILLAKPPMVETRRASLRLPLGLLAVSVMLAVAHSWYVGTRSDWALLGYRPLILAGVPFTEEGSFRKPAKGDQCFLVTQPCTPYEIPREMTLGPYRAYSSFEYR